VLPRGEGRCARRADGLILVWDRASGKRRNEAQPTRAPEDASFILGMDWYNNPAIADTVTFQFDLNLGP